MLTKPRDIEPDTQGSAALEVHKSLIDLHAVRIDGTRARISRTSAIAEQQNVPDQET